MPKSTPNYLSIDALGRIVANFSGHITAAGVDLLAGTTDVGIPPSDRKVNWTNGPGGAVVADVSTIRFPSGATTQNRTVLAARRLAAAEEAAAELATYSTSGSERSRLELLDFGAVSGTQMTARVVFLGTTGRICTIITDNGASDFLMTDGVNPSVGPSGIVVGQGNNMAPGTTCPFTIPGPAGGIVTRDILVRMSMTGYVSAIGAYFHGFQIPGVGQGTRDFFYNLTGVHMTAGVVSANFLNVAPGNYAVSLFHNVSADANDRWECSVILTS